ncbi:MAG: type II secretion system protein M [Pseudomonadota bacterium]
MKALDEALQSLQVKAEPLLAKYQELQPRERVVVAVGAVVVLLTLIYLVFWEPLANARAKQFAALTDERALAERLETIGATVQKARASGVGAIQGREQSLLTLIDQQGRAPELGKPPTRMQPEGENEVKVWFEDVSFDALVRWMAQLETRNGVKIVGAEIERRAGAGLVNARLTVTRP